MSVRIRYRLAPTDPWTVTEVPREDPFEVCNAVHKRIFPNVPLLERDERFDAVMNQRQAGWEDGAREAGVAAAEAPLGAGVRDTSKAAYRKLQWNGTLSKQQERIVEFIRQNQQRDFTRHELAEALDMDVNAVCGRVKELLDFTVLEEGAPRQHGGRSSTAHPLRLAHWMRRAA